ncbi:MAG: hypothetical protein Q9219_006647 [cf. Caloplaca sp. 3 TL-2023]
MDGCPHLINATVPKASFTWGEALDNRISNMPTTNYFRPDIGIALMPWVYTVIVIVVHLPMVLVRVTRWEIVQVWSIIFTLFTVIIVIQAYVSTRFDPAQILLWTPLLLVIDGGSMAQVFFLVLEAKQNIVGNRVVLSESQGQESSTLRSRLCTWWSHCSSSSFRNLPRGKENIRWYQDPAVFSASAAAILFLTVVALQVLGLVQAARAVRSFSGPPLVSWCSPLFQPFGLAAVDSNCQVYDITQSAKRGIGCVKIPGVWQQQWVVGTVVGTSLALVYQVADVLLLALVSSSKRVRGAKLRRPWTTIFGGLTVLGVTLVCGVQYTLYIPHQMGTRVLVAMDVQGPASYLGDLTPAGLRGAIIGWSDGLFGSWGTIFFGDPNF